MTTQTKLILLLLLLTTTSAYSCAGQTHRQPHHTKLSKAMEKASDNQEDSRNIETDKHTPSVPIEHHFSSVDPDPTIAKSPSQSEPPSSKRKENKQPSVTSLSLGYGVIKGDDIYQINHIELAIGEYLDEKKRIEGFISAGYALIDESATLDNAISDAWLFSIGARYKYFSTPRYTFLGHYFAWGVSYSHLFWTYENAIQLDDRQVSGDNLGGFELFVGMGLHLAQTERYQVGLEILPSVILWSAYTDEGFDNDVFGPLYMLKVRLTLSYLK